jgi:DNA-binding response OmpR family regulator
VPQIRVLVVDDAALTRQMLRRVLQDAGFAVDFVQKPGQGVSLDEVAEEL